jgi:hypothetical protein
VTSSGSVSVFAGFRFPPEVISVAVRWLLRYGLSYRDVRVQDGSWGGEMQLDLMRHDPEPASRWPGTLRGYGRHTDRTRYSRGGKWRNSRSAAIPMGRDGIGSL